MNTASNYVQLWWGLEPSAALPLTSGTPSYQKSVTLTRSSFFKSHLKTFHFKLAYSVWSLSIWSHKSSLPDVFNLVLLILFIKFYLVFWIIHRFCNSTHKEQNVSPDLHNYTHTAHTSLHQTHHLKLNPCVCSLLNRTLKHHTQLAIIWTQNADVKTCKQSDQPKIRASWHK